MLRKASQLITEKQQGKLRVTISGRHAPLDKVLLVLLPISMAPLVLCFVLTLLVNFTLEKIATLGFWLSALFIAFLLLSIAEATFQVIWDASGKETLEIGDGRLRLQRQLLRVVTSVEYNLADTEQPRHISRLRTWPIFGCVPKLLAGMPLGPHQSVGFSYQGKNVRFGTDLTEEDAKHLLVLMKKYRHEINKRDEQRFAS